jgi:diaminopimelate decarboxylase
MALSQVTRQFRNASLNVLNVGGGLDDSTEPDFREELAAARTELGLEVLIIEPGRRLLNPCVDLVATIVALRKRHGSTWIHLDAGIYQGLLDAALVGRHFPMTIVSNRRLGEDTSSYLVAGPSPDSLDFLGEYKFPGDVHVGDQVLISDCGAYTWTLRTAFGGMNSVGFEVAND